MNEPVINELGINNADTYINEFGGLVTDNGHASAELVIKMTDVSKWYGDFQVLTH